MKKNIVLAISLLVISLCAINKTQAAPSYYKVNAKNPSVSESIKPAVAKYKTHNYVGAMQDLEAVLQKEPHNMTGIYYLALAYTQMGYRDKARQLYQILANSNGNEVIVNYSQRALDCLDSPDSAICLGTKEEKQEEVDDMTKFIQSGVKIHPYALDTINNERMIRRMQEQEYLQKQQEALKPPIKESNNSQPTNKEILDALNTLSKIGYNPFGNEYNMLSQMSANNINMPYGYPSMMSANNTNDFAQMMMFNQLSQYNNLLDYGI